MSKGVKAVTGSKKEDIDAKVAQFRARAAKRQDPADPTPLKNADSSVLVIVPCTGTIDAVLALWLFRQASPSSGIGLHIHTRGGFVEDTRQEVADIFLQKSNAQWLFMVDSDTIPSRPVTELVARATQVGAKLVSYPTPFHANEPGVASNLFLPRDEENLGAIMWNDLPWDRTNTFFKVTAAGLGATLIHRDVLDALMEKALLSGKEGDFPFRAVWKDGKVDMGEDQAFFIRAGMAGFQPYADLWCPCSHRKLINMTPNHAVDDLSFVQPGVRPHPNAPYIPGVPAGKAMKVAMEAAVGEPEQSPANE